MACLPRALTDTEAVLSCQCSMFRTERAWFPQSTRGVRGIIHLHIPCCCVFTFEGYSVRLNIIWSLTFLNTTLSVKVGGLYSVKRKREKQSILLSVLNLFPLYTNWWRYDHGWCRTWSSPGAAVIPGLCFPPPHITTRHSNSTNFSENSRAACQLSWNTPSAHQMVSAFTIPKMERCGEGGFLLLFTELRVGSCPAWLQTPLQILLFLTSASLRPMFRCSQIGEHSEIELKVKAVTGSLGAQSNVITYLDYTSQGLRPHYQGRTQNNDLVVHKTVIIQTLKLKHSHPSL